MGAFCVKRTSISQVISTLAESDKRYDILYKDSGFELGFGRGGSYEGHSHLYFVDVLFSPAGIQWNGGGLGATLVVVPPRTYLPRVETGDFVFLKFCPDAREVILPDKVSSELSEQHVMTYGDQADLEFPWYRSADSASGSIQIVLNFVDLRFEFSGWGALEFGP